MLFVDHRKTQTLESDLVIDQGMGPDNKVDLAILDLLVKFILLGLLDAADKKRDLHVFKCSVFDHRLDILVMLARENLRRGHDAGLMAVLKSHDTTEERDERLARPDVALQETKHRGLPFHVGSDLPDHFFLRASQFERERIDKPQRVSVADLMRDPFFARDAQSPQDNRDLKEIKFLKRNAA